VRANPRKMGITNSALVDVANLNIQFTSFVMVSTMVFCSPKRRDWKDWKGWCFFVLAIYFYHMVVRFGASIRDPLTLYTGQPLQDAKTILYIIDPILALAFGLLGWAFTRVLDIVDLIPLRKKIHYPLKSAPKIKIMADGNGNYSVKNASEDSEQPNKKWGVVGLTPSWSYLIISLIWYLGSIATPQVIYDYYMWQTNANKWWCYLLNVVGPLAGGALFLVIQLIITDPGTFGLTDRYMKRRRDKFNFDDQTIAKISSETRMRVVRSIVTPTAILVISNIALGGVRQIWDDVDPQWIGACGVWGVWFALLVIILAIVRYSYNPFRKSRSPKVNDGGNYVTEIASSITAKSTSLSTKKRNVGSLLGGEDD
jgi:hypothetical protein